ncbi:hypothetical protein [uncultured Sphingomonas sp.]|uniref:hypothetical protein n=1 Tax=uncultured Sphingomonas sp. TaxID=158754 RepID=UPI0025F8A97C|nr:hypothetical protein [uncultured Sphingomonas sp.]
MREEKKAVTNPREPPKYMQYLIWSSFGEDALITFEENFERAVSRFGYKAAWIWGLRQCLRIVPHKLWALILKIAGSW